MSGIQKYIVQFEKLCQSRTRVLVLVTILTVVAIVGFQNLTLNSGDGSLTLFPLLGRRTLPSHSPSGTEEAAEVQLSSGSENSPFPSHELENREIPNAGERGKPHHEMNEIDGDLDDFHIDGDGEPEDELSIDLGNGVALKTVKDPYGGYITVQKSAKEEKDALVGMDGEPGRGFVSTHIMDGKTNFSLEFDRVKHLDNNSLAPSLSPYPASSFTDKGTLVKQNRDSTDSVVNIVLNSSSSGEKKIEKIASGDNKMSSDGKTTTNCTVVGDHATKKKMKQAAVTLSDMNNLLSKSRVSSCSMIPQWSSPSDLQILDAKKQIVNAPIVKSDPELYPAIFRNVSMFKRSYELMENILKVYVYKEGEKPIFHQPELTGIYSSEGWFMKHMEGNKHFAVEDPRQAHLFYMPFSSHLLQFRLYVPGSHSHANLVEYLKNYVDTIAAKYPFWNRTYGADHFAVGCHDWATHETGQAMRTSIRALCNADVTEDFELGKDVSLPETYVRNRENPLRDLGGRPAKKRPILAFFAGQMHGYLRPILLQHWENKDPDLKIFGPMPRGSKKKASYVQYMKSSRYCLCPRGYEVNSPRVVEAIFYECVPVIISDNFVPPFFEVLNWEAFSVVVPEKDVPRLKEILVSIPKKKYLRLQMGVKKVQQHFLWHRQPVKYDMFHMILHSIWFNRVFQLRVS